MLHVLVLYELQYVIYGCSLAVRNKDIAKKNDSNKSKDNFSSILDRNLDSTIAQLLHGLI